jgi:hypothetical protein
MKRFKLGQFVEARFGDVSHYGYITQVNDLDQGEFEYYVTYDDDTGSFWNRESLRVVHYSFDGQFRYITEVPDPKLHARTQYSVLYGGILVGVVYSLRWGGKWGVQGVNLTDGYCSTRREAAYIAKVYWERDLEEQGCFPKS